MKPKLPPCPYCGSTKGHYKVCKEMMELDRLDLIISHMRHFVVAKTVLTAITNRSKKP